MASSASLSASGRATSLVYAAARLLYARGSDLQRDQRAFVGRRKETYGNRLMASV